MWRLLAGVVLLFVGGNGRGRNRQVTVCSADLCRVVWSSYEGKRLRGHVPWQSRCRLPAESLRGGRGRATTNCPKIINLKEADKR